MPSNGKFILKVILIILAILAGIFLVQVGRYYYKIKTGKIIPRFTNIQTISQEQTALNTKEILNGDAPYFGAASPELTIVEFGSFSCPYSKKASASARELMLKYKDKVKFIYRDFPVDELYPESSGLALVGKCANGQNKFWAMHDKLYQSDKNDYLVLAKQSGLDEIKFLNCIKEQTYLKNIYQDLTDGNKNGVRGTPTFFFIKKEYESKPVKIEGAIPKKTFEEIIKKLL